MKKRTKRLLMVIGISPLAVAFLWCLSMLWAAGAFKAITVKFRLDNLLHHTDYRALLDACRLLMKEGYRGQYNVEWPNRDPEVDRFPKAILALKPTYVSVQDDGRVVIEMWGGMSHYGVVAYAEDFKEPSEGYVFGNKKLIDGLWFYSDFIDLREAHKQR